MRRALILAAAKRPKACRRCTMTRRGSLAEPALTEAEGLGMTMRQRPRVIPRAAARGIPFSAARSLE